MKSSYRKFPFIRGEYNSFVPDSYCLMLALLNCALQAHFHWAAKGALVIPLFLLFYNYRLWMVSLAQIAVAMYYLIPLFPRQANHANVEFFVAVVIFALFVQKLFTANTPITPALTSWLFRIVTFGMYFYSGFHKLNSDFFDSTVSCVNEYWTVPLTEAFTSLGCENCGAVLIQFPFPFLTILFEMVLPFGLFWRRTRMPVAVLLLAFHAYLSYQGLLNFGTLAVFLIAGSIINFEEKVTAKMVTALRIYLVSILICSILFLFALVKIPGFQSWHFVTVLSTIAFSAGIFCFFRILFRENQTTRDVVTKKQVTILAAVFFCLSFWALKNYIGLGTTGNFTMFSNLSTEKSRSNHLLIDTRKTKIWDFEEDYVQLVTLDSTVKLQAPHRVALLSSLLPVVQFSWFIKKWSVGHHGKMDCTLIYKGQVMKIDDLKKSQFSEYSWWYQLLPFRPLQIDGPSDCKW